jgi:hypothetical protein
MIRENAQNRCPGRNPEETRPLAALRNDDRHFPWPRIPPTADSKNHPQVLSLPPRPPQSTDSTTAKEITNDIIFETKHHDDE